MIQIMPVAGIGEVDVNTDLAAAIADGLGTSGIELQNGDVVVVTHKIVSKAEGAVAAIGDDEAAYRALAAEQSIEILRRRGDLIIAKTRHGFVCANAGVDRSNAAPGTAVLLPVDPDRSAHRLRILLERSSGATIAVVITDTFGRAWRRGLVDVAIGVSGMPAILDLRGTTDMQGRTLEVTEVAVVDEIAAAADLAMGKATGIPVAVVRGLTLSGEGRASDLVRPPEEDLFR